MGKDAKGHGSNARGAKYGSMTDDQLDRRYKKLSSMENPTDAHADALELVVDERSRRKGAPAPAPGRGALPAKSDKAANEEARQRALAANRKTDAARASKAGFASLDAKISRGLTSNRPNGANRDPSPAKPINSRGDTFKPRKGD